MKFSSSAITAAVFGLLASSAVAAPTANEVEKRDDCTVQVKLIDQWTEDALSRYRVGYATSKTGFDMKKGGDLFKQSISQCSAINNNIACYYHSASGNWVIDNNQVYGAGGDDIESCLIHNFITAFAGATGCRAA